MHVDVLDFIRNMNISTIEDNNSDDDAVNRHQANDHLEKSFENMNINISKVVREVEDLSNKFQHFSVEFQKNQERLFRELQKLKAKTRELRQQIIDN